MAGNILIGYGTTKQAITVTLASLTTGSARQSTYVDNASNLYTDYLVQIQIKSGGSGTASTGYANIYVYGTVDTTDPVYSSGATGSDGSFTVLTGNMTFLGRMPIVANSTTYVSQLFSVAAAFGGSVPQRWGIIVENQSGGTLDSTEGNHLKLYQGIYGTYT